jgi:hypothetical protein
MSRDAASWRARRADTERVEAPPVVVKNGRPQRIAPPEESPIADVGEETNAHRGGRGRFRGNAYRPGDGSR